MATMWVTEYDNVMVTPNGPAQIGQEPSARTQTITISGASTQIAAAFLPGTKLVRLRTDTKCCYKFGLDPVASVADASLGAEAVEYFGVAALPALSVAAIANP